MASYLNPDSLQRINPYGTINKSLANKLAGHSLETREIENLSYINISRCFSY